MYTLCLPLSEQSIDLLYYERYLLVRKTIIVILSGKHVSSIIHVLILATILIYIL